jgi:ABC-type glycerol-3-phosphate transport system substrate-binding protein
MVLLSLPLVSCTKTSTPRADIVVWHWMTDRQPAFEKIAEEYKKKTGVTILFETYAPTDVYQQKVRAAASGNLLPEIYSPLSDKRETASFINSGHIADLTQAIEADGWGKRFFPKPLAQNTYQKDNQWNVPAGVYGVPIDVSAMMIFYNKDLFKQAGLDPEKPPRTWDEFIDAGKKLRAANIQPFVSGFGERWLSGAFVQSFAWNLLGKQGMIDTIEGKITYTDPRWVRVYKVIEEMKNADMFASGIVTMNNKDAERAFATGRAAMAFNGSWSVNVYYTMNPNLNFGVMMPPKLKEGKFPMLIFGGEGSSLNVNAASPNKDKAVEFLKWLTEKDQQVNLARETRNIPSNKEAVSDLPPVLKTFAESIDLTFDTLPVVKHWQV